MTIDMRQYREAFIREVKTSLEIGRTAVRQFVGPPPDRTALERITRFFHTLAGTAAVMDFHEIAARCRTLEAQYRKYENGPLPSSESIDALMKEMDAMEQLLLTENGGEMGKAAA